MLAVMTLSKSGGEGGSLVSRLVSWETLVRSWGQRGERQGARGGVFGARRVGGCCSFCYWRISRP